MNNGRANKPTLLIVDDVTENIHAIMNILRESYALLAATSGEKALELAASTRPDLILLDINMPGMGGYEVLSKLKSGPPTEDIPVIFVTAMDEPVDEIRGLKMGAADYITKPLHPDLLRVRVAAQIQLRHFFDARAKSKNRFEPEAQERPCILIVDDVPENVHELVGALSDEYRVIVARNGPKAIELTQSAPSPDLILLDIKMPGMDGYEVCRRIKASEAGCRIPIIFVSVLDEPGAKIRGFSLGAADYITKPFDIDEARARIHSHIHLSKLRFYFEEQVAQRTAALRTTTNQLQATLSAIPDLLLELDLDGSHLIVHSPHAIVFAEPREQLNRRSISETMPASVVDVYLAALQEANETGSSHGRQFELAHSDSRAWFELSVARKDDPVAPAQPRFIVVARDITDRHRMEDEIRQLNADLEERVRERTAELDAANRELQTFTYSVSHDLKAPLRGIDGYSRLLLDGYHEQLCDEGRQYIENVRAGVAQMSQLIADLLAYTRLERNGQLRETVDLSRHVAMILEHRRADIQARGMLVDLALPEGLSARADLEGLSMALRNLLDNALKFTRGSRLPSLVISASQTDKAVVLTFKDNGIGFDMRFHDRIFEIFQRLQRAEDYPGTGVGLAIVHKAAQRMGGRIWAESAPAQGACFFLELPR